MFDPNGVALDIFGDKETSDARRRCQPADGDEAGRVLMDMHLSVANIYAVGYIGLQQLPWCDEEIRAEYEAIGCSLSLTDDIVEGDSTAASSSEGSYSHAFDSSADLTPGNSMDTPWGLAKAYVDETLAFLMENDGWNADGGLGGREVNRIPFTGDFSYADSAGNE